MRSKTYLVVVEADDQDAELLEYDAPAALIRRTFEGTAMRATRVEVFDVRARELRKHYTLTPEEAAYADRCETEGGEDAYLNEPDSATEAELNYLSSGEPPF